jgi:hypothetical protein
MQHLRYIADDTVRKQAMRQSPIFREHEVYRLRQTDQESGKAD